MTKSTVTALMARGLDSTLSERIAHKGHTLSALKGLTEKQLMELGLSATQAEAILSESRPPIPPTTVNLVLYKNRRTCCVCRVSNQPVIIHHIDEWAKSRSHAEKNLAVLCLDCHDDAHTKRQLSQNLTADEIAAAKERWESDVEQLDAKSILKLKHQSDYSNWTWINIPRIYELAQRLNITVWKDRRFNHLREKGLIDLEGNLNIENVHSINRESHNWFLDFGDGYLVAGYLDSLVCSLLERLPIIDITASMKKHWLKSTISAGDYIAAQLPFYFKNIEDAKDTNRTRKAYFRGNSIRIEYTFDSWYCLSSSARFCATAGRKVQTFFGLVRSILEEDDELVITISCLAAGSSFTQHPAKIG
jgi:hypothetical protein